MPIDVVIVGLMAASMFGANVALLRSNNQLRADNRELREALAVLERWAAYGFKQGVEK